jgi:hypothetical protein
MGLVSYYKKALLIFLFLTTGLVLGQESLEPDMFALGTQVSSYLSFKVADSIPKGTEVRRANFHYYLHDNADSFLFLNRPIDFVIAVTNLKGQIVSISLVTKYDDGLLDDLQNKYGRWTTASLGTVSETYDSLDTSKFSFYSWRKEKNRAIDLRINRYLTSLESGNLMNDYAIISRRSKDYWE